MFAESRDLSLVVMSQHRAVEASTGTQNGMRTLESVSHLYMSDTEWSENSRICQSSLHEPASEMSTPFHEYFKCGK